jgi:hypothetical protein
VARLQFTLGQLGVFLLALSVALALSLWLTDRDPLETAANLVQITVVCYALLAQRQATWPGVVAGALLAAGDAAWIPLMQGRLPSGKLLLFWMSYTAWFGAGCSATARGRFALGMGLMTTALVWLLLVFAVVWFRPF